MEAHPRAPLEVAQAGCDEPLPCQHRGTFAPRKELVDVFERSFLALETDCSHWRKVEERTRAHVQLEDRGLNAAAPICIVISTMVL